MLDRFSKLLGLGKVSAPTDTNVRYQYTITPYHHSWLKQLAKKDKKPVVIVLVPDDEVGTNPAIEYFKAKGLEVIGIRPEQGTNHPIFAKIHEVDGIYLPGGADVRQYTDDYSDHRLMFERALIDFSKYYHITLLGICRGEQSLGFKEGGFILKTMAEVDEHYKNSAVVSEEADHPCANNTVLVQPGNQLHAALREKVFPDSDPAKELKIDVACLHWQHLTPAFFGNSSIKVTSYTEAGGDIDNAKSIESIETPAGYRGKFLMVGLQHHPEKITDYANKKRKKKLVKIAAEDDLTKMFHYQDPEASFYIDSRTKQKINRANQQSLVEKVAHTELDLLTDQARHRFLDRNPIEPKPEASRVMKPTTKDRLGSSRGFPEKPSSPRFTVSKGEATDAAQRFFNPFHGRPDSTVDDDFATILKLS